MAGIPKVKITFDADFDELKRGVKGATDEVEGFGSKMGKFSKIAGTAFAVAGAAAVAYGAILLKDGVESALADEVAQNKLATSLENVTGATAAQIAAVEKQITQTSLLFGVTDEDLRPSLDRLVRSTKDVDEAQKLQNLALDIAAGTGKDLQTVSEALAKAHDGNFTALKKLGGGIDENIIKSKDFDAATASLADTFEGQASKKAETFQGKLDRLKIAFDEGKETIGAFVLDAITPMIDIIVSKVIPFIQNFIDSIGGKEGLTSTFSEYIEMAKSIFIPILEGVQSAFNTIKNAVMDNKDEFTALFKFLKDYVAPFMGKVFKIAIEQIGTAIGIVIDLVGGLIRGFETLFGIIGDVVGAIKNLINLVKNNPVVSGISGAISSAFGGFRAAGGSVSAGTPYVVGERGAELFVPSSSGTIVPNGGMGGSTINVTVNGAIDAEGTARTIVDVLNRSNARGTLGANRFALTG
jgi:hypothetical protein